jgi:hypothetical protein
VEQLVSQARMRTRSMPRMRHALLNLAWLENNNNCNLLRAKAHGERTRPSVANLPRSTFTGCYTAASAVAQICPAALEAAVGDLVERHESLRTQWSLG